MAFKIPHKDGRGGGKLMLYVFDDKTYDELEEKLTNSQNDEVRQQFYEKEIKPLEHCLFQTVSVDSEWQLHAT